MTTDEATTGFVLPNDDKNDWRHEGFDYSERERWLAAGLRFGEAALAARCREAGLQPWDLQVNIEGTRGIVHIRGGESTDSVASMLRAQRRLEELADLDGRPSTTIVGVDGSPENDVDRLAAGLRVVLSGYLAKPITVCADSIGIRLLVDGNGEVFRVGAVGAPRASLALDGFRCECHPAQPATIERIPDSMFASGVGITVHCLHATVSGIRGLLHGADDEFSGARVIVDGTAVPGRARAAFEAAGVPVRRGYQGTGRAAVGLGIGEAWLEVPMVGIRDAGPPFFADPLARLSRGRSRGTGVAPRWSGFPVPSVCRRSATKILDMIDDATRVAPAEVLTAVGSDPCPAHPEADFAALLADQELIRAEGPGLIRLTRDGERRSDLLRSQSHPFAWSSAISRPGATYAWQGEALTAWAAHSRCGVVEAVTGTGKTRVGIEAAAEAIDAGFKVVICVPSLVLMEQWYRVLRTHGIRRIGRLGGGHRDALARHDVLIATVQSLRKASRLLGDEPSLLIVDECHRAGAATFQSALDPRYVRRLGLTATFERADDRLRDLEAFFEASPLFKIGYDRAVPDGIVAHYLVARVGVDFTVEEREEYEDADHKCRSFKGNLIGAGVPAEPFGTFMEATAGLAKQDEGVLGSWAKGYLEAFSRRANVLSMAKGKVDAVRSLAPAVASAGGCLLFTMRVAGAEQAAIILREEGVNVSAIHGQSSSDEREEALSLLRVGDLQAVAAPRILDEGVDVPEADLGIIIATSSRRLQMIQRMGRVLRLKKDRRRARFVLLYVRGTAEDPTGQGRAHEAFFDAITPTADAVADFELDDVGGLHAFLDQQVETLPVELTHEGVEGLHLP